MFKTSRTHYELYPLTMRTGPVPGGFSLVVVCVEKRYIYFGAFNSIFKTSRTHYESHSFTMRAGNVPGAFSLVVLCVESRVIFLIMNISH